MRWLLPLLLLAGLIGPAAAAPSAERWALWERHDDANPATIDQQAWGRFLRTYLRPGADGVTRVAYAAVTPADRTALEADLRAKAALPISRYSRREQQAYWTNLYNALTAQVVLQHYPVESINTISLTPGLFSARGPWGKKLIEVEGTPVSLNDIEHRILRPIWRDARTHYAVNCASIGCPNLAAEPYSAANMEALLDRGARAYVNHPRGARVANGRLTASRIYDWYQADFGGNERGVVEHLGRYATPPLAQALLGVDGVSGYAYDWSLNDASRP